MIDYTQYKLHHWAADPEKWKAGTLHLYHSHALAKRQSDYVMTRHEAPAPRTSHYRPVPWDFQYDLEMYLWVNWAALTEEETAIHKARLDAEPDPEKRAKIEARLNHIATKGFTGFPRHEHLMRAAELRWPTYWDTSRNKWSGLMKRSAWMEELFAQWSADKRTIHITYGGGAQGKTTMGIAVGLMVWDHFISTERGALMAVSTISQKKLEGTTWATLTRLYRGTAAGVSRYAGRAVKRGTGSTCILTRTRPDAEHIQESDGCTINGVVGRADLKQEGRDRVRDTLTGNHGFEAKIVILDEAQACLDALFTGVENYFTSVPDWVSLFMAFGNFTCRTDTLGRNTVPIAGWDSVTMDAEHPFGVTHYAAHLEAGARARVTHLNNLKSPRWSSQGDPEMYSDLWKPSVEDGQDMEMLLANPHSASFIVAWHDKPALTSGRVKAREGERPILESAELAAVGAGQYVPVHMHPQTGFLTYDAAPGFGDRNTLVAWVIGNSAHRGHAVAQPVAAYLVPPLKASAERGALFADYILGYAERAALQSNIPRNIVYDESSHGMISGAFGKAGWVMHPFLFCGAVPSGGLNNLGLLEPVLNVGEGQLAHEVALNKNALGAYLLWKFTSSGQICNIDPRLFEAAERMVPGQPRFMPDAEFYTRTIYQTLSKKMGRWLWQAQSKKELGRSTDWLDVLMIGAYHCAAHYGMIPGMHDPYVSPDADDPLDGPANAEMTELLAMYAAL